MAIFEKLWRSRTQPPNSDALCRQTTVERLVRLLSKDVTLHEQLARDYRWLVWRRTFLWRFVPLIFLLMFSCYVILEDERVSLMLLGYARYSLVYLLPAGFINWNVAYNRDCLLPNPNWTPSQLLQEDCANCNHIDRVFTLNKATEQQFSDDFLRQEVPVLISSTNVFHWPLRNLGNVSALHSFYTNEPLLNRSVACNVQSNIDVGLPNQKLLLRHVLDTSLKNWFFMWEHCHPKESKLFRRFYRRPDFLPPTIDTSGSSWLLLADSYTGSVSKTMDTSGEMLVFAQVRGRTSVYITPREPCGISICRTLKVIVREGEILAVTMRLWQVDVLPDGEGLNVAIGIPGTY